MKVRSIISLLNISSNSSLILLSFTGRMSKTLRISSLRRLTHLILNIKNRNSNSKRKSDLRLFDIPIWISQEELSFKDGFETEEWCPYSRMIQKTIFC